MSETFVKSFAHLRDHPKAEHALPMLQRVASLVKPIMRKHAWVLPVLSEFFPESPNLVGLNINGGQKILLRLRPPHAPDTFYDEEQLVGVMLHELTHNVHGPHNEQFYKFLAGLEDEYDALKQSGYAGEGFHSKGHRVGMNVSHNLPPHLARQKALQAAEQRRKIGLLSSGGGRLGGTANNGNRSPRELAAEAAEKRARDEKACGSGQVAIQEAEKAAQDSVEDRVIDLTIDSESDGDVVVLEQPTPRARTPSSQPHDRMAGPPSNTSSGSRPPRVTRSTLPPSRPSHTPRRTAPSATPPNSPARQLSTSTHGRSHIPLSSTRPWSCPRCTLVNEALVLQCAACMLIRPGSSALEAIDGWTCHMCGETGISHQFWSCQRCGSVKTSSTIG